ncbi:MAG: putative signal transduction histidine kinase [Ilumatobacteraceae bacterium]|nr:putative signal transduction histidine kinase [Ilumatobacteraceae bacterium]
MSGEAGQHVDGDTGSAPLSWPLVERRRNPQSLAEADRAHGGRATLAEVMEGAPLAPFRIAAVIGSFVRGFHQFGWRHWDLTVCGVIVVAYTIFAIWRPVAYVNDSRARMRTVIEAAIIAGVVITSGGWTSPYALCLVPTAMLAAFVGGTAFAAQVMGAAAAITSLQYLNAVGVRDGLPDSALWIGLLALVTATGGVSFRAAQRSASERLVALDRVGRLAEANALLFSLQRVAHTLPASLDLEDVLDSTVARVRSLIDHDTLTILLRTELPDVFETIRATGSPPGTLHVSELPRPLRDALAAPRTMRVDQVASIDEVMDPGARSGLYASLRARGAVVGLIAVESTEPDHFGPQQAEVLHGLTDPFGIAIDNAKLFQRLRTVSADEERKRIARDLHDHIGSSLAYLGFEIDRSIAAAGRGEPVDGALRDLRSEVTSMVGEVRETLYDLRADVSEAQDLAETLSQFVERVRGRSGLDISLTLDQRTRLSLHQERELWHIAREALINVERHAQASHAGVEWTSTTTPTGTTAALTVRDNGVGLLFGPGRVDSYGMRGMRERAASVGAQMTTDSSPTGTVIRVVLHQPTGSAQPGGTRWD